MNFVELVLSVGSFNGLLMGLILFSLNNANQLATRIFGVIIILFSLIIADELIEYTGLINEFPAFISVTDGFTLLIGPLLFVYGQLITERKKKLVVTDIFHLLPFLFLTMYLLPFYLLSGDEKLSQADYDPFAIITFLKAIITASYITVTLRFVVVFERSELIRAFPANNHRNIKWFKAFLWALIIVGFLSILITILFESGTSLRFDPDTFSVLALSLLFYINSFVLIRNPFILWSIRDLDFAKGEHLESELSQNETRYKTSPLSHKDLHEYMDVLMRAMEVDKPYLNPELSPSDLEELTGIKTYYVSQTLNEVLNKNFYEFVNAYRVEESKRLILDESQKHKTLLALGMESGFNSKSSFNRVFKQYTGLTPSQFKRKYESS